ncbi:MAG: HEAT repeat domain-containing protein [Deltaproteobacteria bacterium]|nr:HEAT repeat domain-containing protein [Deltaproteobacteria bacterium]
MRVRLEQGQSSAAEAVKSLAVAALEAPTRHDRLDACRLLGDLAGRALGADWDVAERAAFALLEAARVADTAADRRGVLAAMGRGFRNIWLLPFVHRRLSDRDETIAAVALQAAGGLGFPALEESVAAFVSEGSSPSIRKAAIEALGRMGAMSAVDRLVPLILGDPSEAACALTALTEIRSPAGRDAALVVLDQDLEPEVQIASVRYLAELGALEVLAVLRRLARHDDASIRLASSLASRALKAERSRDAGERFLIALSEPDRAVRAVLARRLRTLPVAEVLEQAEVLLGEDAAGVVQILAEIRENEVTKYFLQLAARADLPVAVRARAIGSIEANATWERDELAKVALSQTADDSLRASAIQAMGAFALSTELLDRVSGLASSKVPAIRGAVLWALQLARRPGDGSDGPKIAAIVAPMLEDSDAMVRRRATYVAGNLNLDKLAPALAKMLVINDEADEKPAVAASTSGQFSSAAISIPLDELLDDTPAPTGNPPDIRLAGYVALGELGMPGVISEVVAAMRREKDPRVLGAASNALISANPDSAALAPLAGRANQLLKDPDPRMRHAGAEIAGLLGGAVAAAAIAPLAEDDSPTVRGAAVWALGKLADASTEKALLSAFKDEDPAVHERAAAGLLRLGTPRALVQAIEFVAGDGDPSARGSLAAAITISKPNAAALAPAIDAALAKVDSDDAAFEPLLRMKLAIAAHESDSGPALDVDAEIISAFPAYAQLVRLSGFEAMVKSLRTAESLFHSTGAQKDADLSPPITLWMKVLENYVHAWLGPRMAGLQREPAVLFDYVDRVIGGSWQGFQRWLEPKWKDPAEVGGARVDIPLRSIPNAARDLQEHKRKRLDSPLSVTEWARMIVLFAVDHPSGFKNLMKVGCAQAKQSAEKTVALAHRLHTLAAVRNLVTHRASAGVATLAAFRKSYYTAFEDLVALA